MILDSPVLERLIEAFRRLPGVGKRSAERFALHLLSAPPDEARALSAAIQEARARIRNCGICGNLAESDPCTVCTDERRDRSVLCVVERPSGAAAIEKGGTYRGLYHVLNGVLNPLEGIGPSELGVSSFLRRLEEGEINEVIVGTNSTPEGEATALFLSRQVAARGILVTRIAQGVPMGGGLEFADEATLNLAIRGRTKL